MFWPPKLRCHITPAAAPGADVASAVKMETVETKRSADVAFGPVDVEVEDDGILKMMASPVPLLQ